MKKILFTLGFMALASTVQAAGTASEQAALNGRIKLLEDRLDALENDVKAMKNKKQGALDEANMTNDEVQKWASSSVTNIYSYDFANVDQTLARLRYLFTTQGYDSFLKALKESGNLKFVQDKKLIVNAQPNGTSKIDAQGLDGNAYAWRVSVPVTVTYQNSLEKFSQNVIVEVEVLRVNAADVDSGVAINYVNASLAPKPGEKPVEKTVDKPADGNGQKPVMPKVGK